MPLSLAERELACDLSGCVLTRLFRVDSIRFSYVGGCASIEQVFNFEQRAVDVSTGIEQPLDIGVDIIRDVVTMVGTDSCSLFEGKRRCYPGAG